MFAYSQWQNLSPLIITLALLGFGASGTAAVLRSNRTDEGYLRYMFITSMLFPVFLAAGFYISAFIRFNPYGMSLDIKQVFSMLLYFVLMGIPFFAGASVICIGLMRYSIPSAYFFNLTGSGAGALAAMAALFFLHPYDIMTVIILISFIPVFLMASLQAKKSIITVLITLSLTAGTAIYISSLKGYKKVSEYKSISGALNLPGAKVLYEGYSPLSVVQVVEAEGLRSTAGLSLASPYQVPVQKGIFFDGDSLSTITPFGGNLDKLRYMEYIASYLPFYMQKKQKNHYDRNLLIIGSGGGESILKSMISGYKKVDAVEVNSNVISLMRGEFARYSGYIYSSKNLTVYNSDGRSFIKQSPSKYDLIEISLIDAYNTSASGVYALNETYLYTVESFADYFNHLTDDGMLSVTRWVTTPPKDTFKIINTAIESLRMLKIKDKEKHIAAIRSLQTVTLLLSKNPFTTAQILDLKRYCSERYFDIIYYPGAVSGETNIYIKHPDTAYFDAFIKLLSDENLKFINGYDFDITAPTDDRPYFYNFFKPGMLGYIKKYGPSQIPVTEWGYLILLIILIPVAFISFISIIIPAVRGDNNAKPDLLLFFSLIAAGYFFFEMPLIQKMALFLGHSSYSISVIVSGLLVFSGAGSYFSGRFFPGKYGIMLSSFLIAAIILLYNFLLHIIPAGLFQSNIYLKIISVMIIIAPPAFFMGLPFPQALIEMKKRNITSMPLAWGVNGFFSVISIITAALIAIVFGFNTVFITAVICYILAGLISLNFFRNKMH